MHAAVAGAGQLGGGAGEPGGAEVLDARDQVLGEQFQGALDQQLLHEGVADLDAGTLRRAVLVEGLGRQDGRAADAVTAGGRAVQDHLVAGAAGERQVQVVVLHHADAQGVDQGVSVVGGVEDHLAADVRQAETVAVAADAGDDPGQHPGGVGGVQGAEPQRVHHADRPGAHGQDVADDAAHAGRGALVGLHVGRVVVRLDLEGDRPVAADVDHAGLLADAGQQPAPRGLAAQFAELLQVHLGRLVGAVLRPHHRVHGQFAGGGPAAEDLADLQVLVLAQAEGGPRLFQIGCFGSMCNGVNHGHKLPRRHRRGGRRPGLGPGERGRCTHREPRGGRGSAAPFSALPGDRTDRLRLRVIARGG